MSTVDCYERKDNSRCRLDESTHQFSKEKMYKRKSFRLYDFLEKSLKLIIIAIVIATVLLLTFVDINSFIGIKAK